MKKATSISGSSVFRSILAVIIFLTCVTIFLTYTDDISNKVDRIARERVINEINVALAMRLFQSTINGTLNQLADIDKMNPFSVLQDSDYKVPKEYRGELSLDEEPQLLGWYYDTAFGVVFFWDGKMRVLTSQLRFIYSDQNNSGKFEAGNDVIEKLQMFAE